MAKKGPIGKVEGFYIENNCNSLDIDQLAKDLDRTKTSIETYIKKNVANKPSKRMTVGDHFARNRGSVTMTETASTLSDNKRKNTKKSRPSCVIKIKKDE